MAWATGASSADTWSFLPFARKPSAKGRNTFWSTSPQLSATNARVAVRCKDRASRYSSMSGPAPAALATSAKSAIAAAIKGVDAMVGRATPATAECKDGLRQRGRCKRKKCRPDGAKTQVADASRRGANIFSFAGLARRRLRVGGARAGSNGQGRRLRWRTRRRRFTPVGKTPKAPGRPLRRLGDPVKGPDAVWPPATPGLPQELFCGGLRHVGGVQAPAPRVKNIVILLVRRLGRVSSRRCGCKGEHRAEGIVRRCPPALGLFLAGPPIQNGPWHGAGRGL